MNLINEIEKDAKNFLRERRTVLLLIIAPLIVLLITAAVFSGDSTKVNAVAIGVCDLDGSNASQLFISGIRNNSEVQEYPAADNCSAILENDVKGGKLAAGLVIPSGFQSGIESGVTQNISMFLDNSRFQVSPSIEVFVKASVQGTDASIGAQFINSVWARLDSANDKMGQTLININETRTRAQEMKIRLRNTSDSLSMLNISEVRREIYDANNTIQAAVLSLNAAQSNLTKIESNFADYDATLNQTEDDLLQINNSLANVTSYISSARGAVNCSEGASVAYCATLDALNSSLASPQQSVELRIEKVRSARQGLKEANMTIQDFKKNIGLALNGTENAKVRIGNMLGFVDQLEKNRQDALGTISEVDTSLDEMINRTYEFEDILKNSRSQISQITSRSPESIISPMLVSSTHVFGNRPYFEFMLPSMLPLILMFIALFLASTSLVREKNNGTMMRVAVSQVNPFAFSAIKVLSYTIVLIPEAILLALFASILYGAFPVSDMNSWLYVMQALVYLTLTFVAAGILIAVHSESEATAFLVSLVIGLPMLFMSGLLFPFEFMPQPVALVGMASPLSQSVLSMQAVLLYHSPQLTGSALLVAYAIILTLLAGISLKRNIKQK